MAEAPLLLSVRNLCIQFAGDIPFEAVRDLSFSIAKGETLALVGESGSGKSLTALALMGLLPHSAAVRGTCYLQTTSGEADLTALDEKGWQSIRGNTTGIVFQEPMSALNPVMMIGDQLGEAIAAHSNPGKAARKEGINKWLANVQLSPTLATRYPNQLSGGQKQRVMIAIAMCRQPALIIADEPTTALDVTVQREVLDLMRSLQQQYGTSYLFITHDLALAAEQADNVLVLYKGSAVEYGKAADVLYHPQHPYTQALIACRPASHAKGERLPVVDDFLNVSGKVFGDEEPADLQQAIDLPEASPADGFILEAKDVHVWYLQKGKDPFKAVNGVSFHLTKGEILGLAGESGCGKSTLGKALMGLVPMNDGEIIFNNKNLAAITGSEWREVRKSIQLIFQDPFASLNPRLKVGEAIAEPMQIQGIISKKEAAAATAKLLDAVGLPLSAAQKYPHQFSGGQRQRIGIARALGLRPKILICDESVSALDVSVQAQILNLLKDLQKEYGLSYLFISHDLGVMRYLCDRIMIMQAGKIVEEGITEMVMLQPQHAYTQRLLSAIPELRKGSVH